MRNLKRGYFTGTEETPLEQQLYWVNYDRARQCQPSNREGLVQRCGRWTRTRRTRSSVARTPTQPSQIYLADEAGKRLAWVEENTLNASHPYAPYLASHVLPTFGNITGPDGSKLY